MVVLLDLKICLLDHFHFLPAWSLLPKRLLLKFYLPWDLLFILTSSNTNLFVMVWMNPESSCPHTFTYCFLCLECLASLVGLRSILLQFLKFYSKQTISLLLVLKFYMHYIVKYNYIINYWYKLQLLIYTSVYATQIWLIMFPFCETYWLMPIKVYWSGFNIFSICPHIHHIQYLQQVAKLQPTGMSPITRT